MSYEQIEQLRAETAVEGWDGEGSEPVLDSQWDAACQIVSASAEMGVPFPFVSACGDGTAHLMWTTASGDRGFIEIGRARHVWADLPASGEAETVDLVSVDEAFPRIQDFFLRYVPSLPQKL